MTCTSKLGGTAVVIPLDLTSRIQKGLVLLSGYTNYLTHTKSRKENFWFASEIAYSVHCLGQMRSCAAKKSSKTSHVKMRRWLKANA